MLACLLLSDVLEAPVISPTGRVAVILSPCLIGLRFTDGLLAVIDDIAAHLTPDDPPSARAKTLSVFALMVGTLQLSRALANPPLADQVLEQGIHNALTLLNAEQQR